MLHIINLYLSHMIRITVFVTCLLCTTFSSLMLKKKGRRFLPKYWHYARLFATVYVNYLLNLYDTFLLNVVIWLVLSCFNL